MAKYKHQLYHTLKDNKLAPNKRLGQNFLIHKQTAAAIVRAGNVRKTDIILEVGVGLGALTIPLAAKAKHVFGYEIDSGIIRFHEQQGALPDNVTLVHQDILRTDFQPIVKHCGDNLKIIANLPYSISSPFIFKLIDNASLISTATIMLQKELGQRLMAQVNTKEYGVPTVLLASCATVRNVMTLSPTEFHPQPQVESMVVYIDFAKNLAQVPKRHLYDFSLFRRIVRSTFNQRRKTILNTLAAMGIFIILAKYDKTTNKNIMKDIIVDAKLRPSARPETLTTADFIQLTMQIERTREKYNCH